MHRNVELVLGRLATDPSLRARFYASPSATLRDLVAHGIELTHVELDALAATDLDALQAFAVALDSRLRRAAEGVAR